MANRIFSALFLVFFAATSCVFFIIALGIFLATRLFDRRLVILHLFSSFWAMVYLWVLPLCTVKIRGREKLDWNRQYIIVSNHQSQMDILIAFGLFFPFKWVSKAEVFRLPFIGWNMVLNQYIGLKRGDRQSIRKMMEVCEQALDKGCSLYFFPEGTRSSTGELKQFKPGAFILALKKNVPILPVVINGTMALLPKNSLVLGSRQEISLQVLDPIPCRHFRDKTPEEIAAMVRSMIASHVGGYQEKSGAGDMGALQEDM